MMWTARRLGKGPRQIWPRRLLPTYLNYTIGNNSKGYVADCRRRRRRPPCLSSCAAASADAPGGAAEGARGAGDVPGADYCYAAVRVDMMTYHNGDGATVGGTGANAHFLRSRAVTAPHGGVQSRRNRRRRGRLQPRRLRDREDGADRPAVVHGRHGVPAARSIAGGAWRCHPPTSAVAKAAARLRSQRRRRWRLGRARVGKVGGGGRLVYQPVHTWRRGSAGAARARRPLRHVPGGGTPRRRDRR
jgi:hypothetical protein